MWDREQNGTTKFKFKFNSLLFDLQIIEVVPLKCQIHCSRQWLLTYTKYKRKKTLNLKKNTWKLHRRRNNECYCNTMMMMISIKWTMFLLCFEHYSFIFQNLCVFFVFLWFKELKSQRARISNTNELKDNIYMRATGKKRAIYIILRRFYLGNCVWWWNDIQKVFSGVSSNLG